MANGVALLLLAQDVHWLSSDGTVLRIAEMPEDDCHVALDLIELYGESAVSETVETLSDEDYIGPEGAALMILLDLIRQVGRGWLQQTPLVCALRDRSLVSVLA
jgi:hypothetical protein